MSEVMQMATLGRPFQLGMLYDCRSDTLIPGITLWDCQTLQCNLNSRDQPSTEFHIIASDSMEEKATALNVSGSLKLSLLGGLVELKGSAKYLSDTKESKQQARVTLQYKTTTRFEQLTMSHLGRQNITYPSMFDEGSATHVITAVLYGAQAFFVFDQMASSAENLRDIQGNMEAVIKRLPVMAIQGGEASLKVTDEQKSGSNNFRCTFYGDFSLKNNPTTFQDAISTYATLPNLLGSGGKYSVPMEVWLYPLNKLDSNAAHLVRKIGVGLINSCQRVLEQLSEAVMRCNDLMNNSVAIQFPEIGKRLLQFQEMCLEYRVIFQRNLARVLPSIRGGADEEWQLVYILNSMQQSPFQNQSVITWLDDKEQEMKVVRYYLKILEGIPVVKSMSELHEVLLDPALDYLVCFTFTTLHQEDFYLSEASNYLQTQTTQKMHTPTTADGTRATRFHSQWFNSQAVSRKMKEQSQLFLDFATANRADGKMKFLVSSVHDDSNIGASIYLYEEGFLEKRCFEPPSQPEKPRASRTTHDSVTLQLHPPSHGFGDVVGYKVEYQAAQQEKWTTLETPDKSHSFTISGLQPHQEYHFRYRAVTKTGVSKVSDRVRCITCPTSPPDKLVFQERLSTAKLSWDVPRQIGVDVNIFRYRIEYREEVIDTEGGLWKEVKTTDNKCQCNLEELKPNTVYRVRVSADCGEAGSSAASDEVSIEMKHVPNRITQKLCEESLLILKGNPSVYKLILKKEVFDQSKKFVKFSFGKPKLNPTMKTLMVLGATGSGKTTLINGMINYILGVEWGHNFRFKLIHENTGKSQAESQTSAITAYQLHHQVGFKIDYSLTIIDTPGFGDTRGISQDQWITDHIREFFNSAEAVDQVDAVCFVVQSSLARLTQTQKYIVHAILSIFGKDIADNIQILVSFSDGQRPPVLEALLVAEVPCRKDENGMPVHFKFNSSAIFAQRPDSGNTANEGRSSGIWEMEKDNDNFDAIYWKLGACSMKKFFTALSTMEAKSLSLTKEVLNERQQLQAAVKGLQFQIRNRLIKLEELRETKRILKENQDEMEANKNYEYEVNVINRKKKNTEAYVLNCTNCHFTCHDPCQAANGVLTYMCKMMDWWGYCKVCPTKCASSCHINEKCSFYDDIKKEKKIYSDLKANHEKASGEMMTAQKIIKRLEQECAEIEKAVLQLIEQSSKHIGRLEEIALRRNPLTTSAYIDLLIQFEEEEAKVGFRDRIRALREVQDQAKLTEKIANSEEI
ncbi:uncharacterized protein LOC127585883 [Pristis pectinata]|uniref:uncharacterized protein LOC127585883 n=1 Tax=Pristis pectinata TaxID=685728 RepID=UPI00223D13ED|nr:uncharacterized protein LOC127585883 [Pristis pectinata]XP_051899558.1 uncharacterized protein LOC127585883 [Pristis pectinata]